MISEISASIIYQTLLFGNYLTVCGLLDFTMWYATRQLANNAFSLILIDDRKVAYNLWRKFNFLSNNSTTCLLLSRCLLFKYQCGFGGLAFSFDKTSSQTTHCGLLKITVKPYWRYLLLHNLFLFLFLSFRDVMG